MPEGSSTYDLTPILPAYDRISKVATCVRRWTSLAHMLVKFNAWPLVSKTGPLLPGVGNPSPLFQYHFKLH